MPLVHFADVPVGNEFAQDISIFGGSVPGLFQKYSDHEAIPHDPRLPEYDPELRDEFNPADIVEYPVAIGGSD